ncbi:WXG100 family type VII secretion target [Actinoplanes sp. NPDC049596]|uniref:WXG100 family type VII secretion target n=1 Tax=unclassified Actinoplanes TaxID=2626549 RepID=UPI00342E8FDC
MAGPWGLTPAELAAARTDSISAATSISEQLGALGRYVDELGSEWMGNAKETFLVLMAEYHQHAASIQRTLDDIAQTIGINHSNVVETESANVRLLAPSGDTQLAPARF